MIATGTGTASSSGWSWSRSPDGSVGVSGDADGEVGPDQPDEGLSVAVLRLDELVRTLREQCPWDREQTHSSLRRYLLEETYETLEALDARAVAEAAEVAGGVDVEDLDRHLCEELGDLLYQVWFQAHLASERGAFDIADGPGRYAASWWPAIPTSSGTWRPRTPTRYGACGTPSSSRRRGGTR